MRWVAFVVCAVAAGVLVVVFAGGNEQPERYSGLPIVAADEARDRHGHVIVARGRYSDGEPYAVFAERDGRTSLCAGLEVGISGCGQAPSRANPLDVSVDESGCPDTVLYGQALGSTRRVEVVRGDGRAMDAHVFSLPSELGHEGVLFAAQERGTVDIRRVRALDDNGDEIAAVEVDDQDAVTAC